MLTINLIGSKSISDQNKGTNELREEKKSKQNEKAKERSVIGIP